MKRDTAKTIKVVTMSVFFILTAYYTVIPFFEPSSIHLNIRLPLWVFYTIQTNIMVCIWYGYILFGLLTDRDIHLEQTTAAALTVYILITGIVYWSVLVPMLGATPALFLPRNIWTHTVTPLFSLWCFFAFGRKRHIELSKIPYILAYPLMYLVFTYLFVYMVYGKYPYPFMNPDVMGGIIPIVIVCFLMLILFLGLSLGIRNLHNKRLGRK